MMRLICCLLAVLLVAIATQTSASEVEPEGLTPARANFSVPKLPDFQHFKRLFNKHYSSLAEELNRKRLFTTRALRALVTAVKYKFRLASSYKRVNDMSDFTPAEVAQMDNRLLATSDDALGADDDFESRALAAVLARAADRKQRRRRKRDVTEGAGPALAWHKIRELSEEERAGGRAANKRFARDEAQLSRNANYRAPDEVFVDHRASGCFAEPRHQGRCGCCYAFAIVAIMEHRMCLQLGKLTPLSEQYFVDCAKGRYSDRLRGCNGGMVSAAGNFVHDFGLETLQRYPYRGDEGVCPYNLDAAPQRAGFVRMDLGEAVHIHQDHWEAVLEGGGPLMVHAAIYTGMIEYGGGIDEAPNCRPKPSHEMVLVGHGREGGRHYWLMRNSYGLDWGERGYWRLDKRATARCMGRYGEAFGTRDGLHFTVRARRTAGDR